MKKSIYSLLVLMTVAFLSATAQKPASPKETVKGTVDGVSVEIIYSAPSAKGRKVMGSLVPYGEVWRTGANKATSIEFDKNVKIEGKDLPKGKYELFTIPGETEWVIIIQKFANQSGAFDYKESNDVLRVTVKSGKTPAMVETFKVSTDNNGVNLQWENTSASFKVKGA